MSEPGPFRRPPGLYAGECRLPAQSAEMKATTRTSAVPYGCAAIASRKPREAANLHELTRLHAGVPSGGVSPHAGEFLTQRGLRKEGEREATGEIQFDPDSAVRLGDGADLAAGLRLPDAERAGAGAATGATDGGERAGHAGLHRGGARAAPAGQLGCGGEVSAANHPLLRGHADLRAAAEAVPGLHIQRSGAEPHEPEGPRGGLGSGPDQS